MVQKQNKKKQLKIRKA